MTYLRNCWYMAAWVDEVEADTMLARTFLDEPVLLFRDAEGAIRAIGDTCPHRFAPLSRGSIANGVVSCGYHGLTFDGSGQCVHNPHGPVLKSMTVKSYPVVEKYRSIWIWMGEAQAADPEMIRDISFLDSGPATAFSKGYMCGHGNYQLFVDNILDLTHIDYLHASTLGSGAFTRSRAKVIETEDRVKVIRECLNEKPSPLQQAFRKITEEDRIDSWNHVEWSAPAVMTLKGGNVPAGEPRDGPHNNMNNMNTHVMTPETATSTHYFFASTRDFSVDDAEFNERYARTRNEIFATEDEPMIKAQQERMGDKDLWQLNPVLLRIDEGAVRVRRKLEQMIAAENSVTPSEPEKEIAAHG